MVAQQDYKTRFIKPYKSSTMTETLILEELLIRLWLHMKELASGISYDQISKLKIFGFHQLLK